MRFEPLRLGGCLIYPSSLERPMALTVFCDNGTHGDCGGSMLDERPEGTWSPVLCICPCHQDSNLLRSVSKPDTPPDSNLRPGDSESGASEPVTISVELAAASGMLKPTKTVRANGIGRSFELYLAENGVHPVLLVRVDERWHFQVPLETVCWAAAELARDLDRDRASRRATRGEGPR